jgi:hypothetical protein
MNARDRRQLAKLFAMLGSDKAPECEAAHKKITAILHRNNKTWNDLRELLQPDASTSAPQADPRDAIQPDVRGANIGPLDLVHWALEEYVALKPHEHVAAALWAMHTHVFDRFMVTPRLLLTSPVRNCGKTTLLNVLKRVVARPEKVDSITPAAIYHLVHEERRTLLVDEADNLELGARGVLRSVLNGGHEAGGTRIHVVGGQPCRFSVFAPVAFAAIGILPLPLMSRCIVIRMERHNGTRKLRRFDKNDTGDLDMIYSHVFTWAKNVTLNIDPEMPAGFTGRLADNWRPLIAIADSCGLDWGARAREAAIVFSRDHHDEDPGVELLDDIRTIFDDRGIDRIDGGTLAAALNDMDDAPWSEWRGIHGDQQPRPLSRTTLAALLRLFGIRSKKFWPLRRDATTRRTHA